MWPEEEEEDEESDDDARRSSLMLPEQGATPVTPGIQDTAVAPLMLRARRAARSAARASIAAWRDDGER